MEPRPASGRWPPTETPRRVAERPLRAGHSPFAECWLEEQFLAAAHPTMRWWGPPWKAVSSSPVCLEASKAACWLPRAGLEEPAESYLSQPPSTEWRAVESPRVKLPLVKRLLAARPLGNRFRRLQNRSRFGRRRIWSHFGDRRGRRRALHPQRLGGRHLEHGAPA